MSVFASLFGKETIVGLDIGSAYLKVVQVESHKRGFRVLNAAQRATPTNLVRDGMVVDRDAVARALRALLEDADISATSASIAVSGPAVVVRQITMPKMTEAALRKSVHFEAAKHIAANIEDSIIEFEIQGPAETEGQMNVMLVAVPREVVESRIAAVEAAGLEVVSVDLESFALQRALVDCNVHQFNDGNMRALVDIGALHSEITLLTGVQFELTRSIPIAGETFSNVLKTQLQVGTEEAERLKMEADLSLLLDADADPEALRVPRILQPMLEELLREVRRSIHYHQAQLPGGAEAKPLVEAILSGGTAQLKGLPEYMQARLGTDVRLANVFDNPFFEAHEESEEFLRDLYPRLSVGLGLAVKEHMPAVAAQAA